MQKRPFVAQFRRKDPNTDAAIESNLLLSDPNANTFPKNSNPNWIHINQQYQRQLLLNPTNRLPRKTPIRTDRGKPYEDDPIETEIESQETPSPYKELPLRSPLGQVQVSSLPRFEQQALDQPRFEQKASDRPRFEQQASDQPRFEQQASNRPRFKQQASDRPRFERQASDRPRFEQQASNQPRFEQQASNQPIFEQQALDRPRFEQQASDRSRFEQQASDRPRFQQQASDRSRFEQQTSDRPRFEQQASDRIILFERPSDRLEFENFTVDRSKFGQQRFQTFDFESRPIKPQIRNSSGLETKNGCEAEFDRLFGHNNRSVKQATRVVYSYRPPNLSTGPTVVTSSPLETPRKGDFNFPSDISVIAGPGSQEISKEATFARMPRVVTMRSTPENGTPARPSEDLDKVSDNEEDGEILSSCDGDKSDDENDDDAIFLVEENGKEVKVKTKSGKEKKHSERLANNEPIELCESVTTHDYKTLGDEEFLNDAIVNFYLTHLYDNLSEPLKEAIHIFSSHFYSRLKGHSRSKNKIPGQQLTQAEKSYLRVKSWTRKIDIFEKRMLIIPICEESHWYLVIVCNPGMVLSAKRTRNFEEKREIQQKLEPQGANPFIMVLDSLGGSHSSAVSKIRSYLQFEHMERKKIPLNFGREKMGEKQPMIPLQPNSCDCGVFLLHYVELIFKDPAKFLGAKLPDLSQWFSSKEIDYKREDIALLIQKIALEQKKVKVKSSDFKFPELKFPATRNRTDTPSPIPEDLPIPSASSERVSDPRLRRHLLQNAGDGQVRQIRIVKSPVKEPTTFEISPSPPVEIVQDEIDENSAKDSSRHVTKSSTESGRDNLGKTFTKKMSRAEIQKNFEGNERLSSAYRDERIVIRAQGDPSDARFGNYSREVRIRSPPKDTSKKERSRSERLQSPDREMTRDERAANRTRHSPHNLMREDRFNNATREMPREARYKKETSAIDQVRSPDKEKSRDDRVANRTRNSPQKMREERFGHASNDIIREVRYEKESSRNERPPSPDRDRLRGVKRTRNSPQRELIRDDGFGIASNDTSRAERYRNERVQSPDRGVARNERAANRNRNSHHDAPRFANAANVSPRDAGFKTIEMAKYEMMKKSGKMSKDESHRSPVREVGKSERFSDERMAFGHKNPHRSRFSASRPSEKRSFEEWNRTSNLPHGIPRRPIHDKQSSQSSVNSDSSDNQYIRGPAEAAKRRSWIPVDGHPKRTDEIGDDRGKKKGRYKLNPNQDRIEDVNKKVIDTSDEMYEVLMKYSSKKKS